MGLRRLVRNYRQRHAAASAHADHQGAPQEEQRELPTVLPHPDQKFGSVSYAQHADDLIVRAVFDAIGIERPSYLDIGAHHPFNISNTALLHLGGSRGINVEANPNLFQAFPRHRPEDVNLNVGVSVRGGEELEFYMIDDWSGRNSFSKETVEEFVQAYPQFKITQVMKIPTMSVQEILDRHAQGQFPDFLTIDVEGLDEAIIRSMDFSKSAPKVICVETVSASGGREDQGVKSYLESQGYFSLIRCGGNSIFAQSRFESMVR